MPSAASILLAHAAATLAMAGLIWFVQVAHYPLFESVGPADFVRYAARHQRRATLVVGPLMLVEAMTATGLVFVVGPASRPWAIGGWLLLAVIWLSTAVVQVPLHRRLADGLDGPSIRRLVRSNWIRTIAWTLRAGVALVLLRLEAGA